MMISVLMQALQHEIRRGNVDGVLQYLEAPIITRAMGLPATRVCCLAMKCQAGVGHFDATLK